ncbi:uncharacterized protein LOC123546133 isoform X1 [Mercenaria mercenaria]|uniref:uncharacterized protein LOC123546133 isoform X1 n=1 Tax=Mercenaria mercenaria TaxID=6596 RepID=UPI00234F40DE|nr:uncharacterized protein LOC123546133 isoform X1 [Mercenaria mercenaria]
MVHCVAFGCNNKSDDGTKGFFLFPKDENLRQKWTNNLNSLRSVDGKLVPFVPSKTSRVCLRHFTDDSFVHSPSVMKSVGLTLKLQLVKGAVPTVFPETVSYKENRKPVSNCLGPAKRKRTTYGAFEKRNRKACVDELIMSHQLLQKEEEEKRRIEEELHLEEVELGHAPAVKSISSIELHGNATSRACQTTEQVGLRNIKVKVRECGTLAVTETKDMMCGPDQCTPSVEKSFQFPENACYDDPAEQSDEEYVDNVEEDPDWEPSADDLADLDEDGDDDENATVWHDCIEDHAPDLMKEEKFIVFQSCLLSLLRLCHIYSGVCSNIKKKVVGSMVIFESVCETGHSRIWRSQPVVSGAPVGNVLSAGALVFSGLSPSKLFNFFKFTNILMIKERTFNRYQKSFVIPAIANTWQQKQNETLLACRGRSIRVGGDARCCSPGHTAKYGSYTLMDLETGMVLATELV